MDEMPSEDLRVPTGLALPPTPQPELRSPTLRAGLVMLGGTCLGFLLSPLGGCLERFTPEAGALGVLLVLGVGLIAKSCRGSLA